MAMINNKNTPKVWAEIEKKLGRPLTTKELYRLSQGDNSVLSKKNKEEGKK
jgi:hypothetical protein